MAGVKGRSGRKPDTTGYRAWCRSVVDRDTVRSLIAAKAESDPDYALRLCEHAYGRPPQALDVTLGNGEDGPIEFRIVDATGAPFALGAGMVAAALPVPGEAAE